MGKFHGFLAMVGLGVGLNASALTLKCGIGSDENKLEAVRSARVDRNQRELTLRFEDKNDFGLKYYQVKLYLDYREEGDRDKDVAELILAPKSGISAISSQKVQMLRGGEAFTLYLVASPTKYVQLLCLMKK